VNGKPRFRTRTREAACPACDGPTFALTREEPTLCVRCVGAEIAMAAPQVVAWNEAIYALRAGRNGRGR
jgi:hypothetical protein